MDDYDIEEDEDVQFEDEWEVIAPAQPRSPVDEHDGGGSEEARSLRDGLGGAGPPGIPTLGGDGGASSITITLEGGALRNRAGSAAALLRLCRCLSLGSTRCKVLSCAERPRGSSPDFVGPQCRRQVLAKESTQPSGDHALGPTADGDVGGAGGKRATRTFTREQREAAALAHRTHALCLLARCVAHDVAASRADIQVRSRGRARGPFICNPAAAHCYLKRTSTTLQYDERA
jgi:hypothetical protein